MDTLKKIAILLGAVLSFIFSIFFLSRNKESNKEKEPFKDIKESAKKDVEKVEKKLDELKKNGVESKTDDEEIRYWKDN